MRALECSGPWPSNPWGSSSDDAAALAPLVGGGHDELVDDRPARRWRSRRTAPPSTPARPIAMEYPYSKPSAAYSESTVSKTMNGAWSSARCASGTYSASVRWSTSTPCRWLNVPRRVSCPARRTGVPLEHQRPERQRFGQRPVDLVAVEHRAPGQELAFELGVDLEAVGPAREPVERRDRERRREPRSRPSNRRRARRRRLRPTDRRRRLPRGRRPARHASPRRRVEPGLEVVVDGLFVVEADVAALDELLRVERADRRVRVDELVHARLREGGLVGLVVSVPPVADEVDDDVLLELRCGTRRRDASRAPRPRGRHRSRGRSEPGPSWRRRWGRRSTGRGRAGS